MSKKVEFFYDYVSLYSYLADTQLRQRFGDAVTYRPIFLGAVMEATGNRPPGTVEAKGRYMRADARRWAERYGVPLEWNPVFPQLTVKALRMALVALHRGQLDAVHEPLFAAMWVEQKDLSDDAVIAAIGEPAGISLEDIGEAAIKEELKANTAEAVQRGVFGAPTFFVGDEMFFGNDRFDFVEEALGRS